MNGLVRHPSPLDLVARLGGALQVVEGLGSAAGCVRLDMGRSVLAGEVVGRWRF